MKALKPLARWFVGPALVLFGIATMAVSVDIDQTKRFIKGGLWVGSNATQSDLITSTVAPVAQVIDVASVGTLACADSAGITVTRAVAGDPCFVGLPAAQPANGFGIFTCVVTATNTVVLRFCNPSAGALDPASATYTFRVISAL